MIRSVGYLDHNLGPAAESAQVFVLCECFSLLLFLYDSFLMRSVLCCQLNVRMSESTSGGFESSGTTKDKDFEYIAALTCYISDIYYHHIPWFSCVAGPLAAQGSGQICCPFVLGF